jgi:GT2 family glycosyltransferase
MPCPYAAAGDPGKVLLRSDTSGQKRMQPAVGAIVLNYLTWEQTVQTVEDLLAQTAVALDVVVVDNASPNDSFAQLERRFESNGRVRVVACERNGGYASGNNRGARWRLDAAAGRFGGARLAAVEYLLIVNNDVRLPERRAVATLAAFAAAHPDAGMVGPRVVTSAGFAQGPYRRPGPLICCLRYGLPIIPLAHRLWRRCWPEQKSRACFALVGACLLIPAAAFAQAGMFDEATFLGAEEYILAERLRACGLRSYHVPGARVVHEHGLSAIRRTGGETRYLPTGVASMAYYFREYQRAPERWIALFERAAAFYGRVFLPLRQRLPL